MVCGVTTRPFKPGDEVWFYPRGKDGPCNFQTVDSDPWMLGGHTQVVRLRGRSGCYATGNMEPMGRWAPVNGEPGRRIPWATHEAAWRAYAAKYGRQQSAERIAERGGFGVVELDMFAPGWR